MNERWDEEVAYDERIAPLMSQIIAVCKERQIPMFASFAYRRGPGNEAEDETSFCTTNLPFDGRKVGALDEACRAVYRASHPIALAITVFRGARSPGDHTEDGT